MADTLPMHIQNFYLLCGTAIPALFIAVVVQSHPRTERRRWSLRSFYWLYGLYFMVLGEVAAMAALLLDAKQSWLQWYTGAGVLIGTLSAVVLSFGKPADGTQNGPARLSGRSGSE